MRVNRKYLRQVIQKEAAVHEARMHGHRIAELNLADRPVKGRNAGITQEMEKLKGRIGKLLKGADEREIAYAQEALAEGPLLKQGREKFEKRMERLGRYEKLSRWLGWLMPAKMYIGIAVRAKDESTFKHMRDIVPIALAIFRNMPKEQRKRLGLKRGEVKEAALLHDVGKLEVPSHILRKSAHLIAAEWEIIKKHPELGEKLLETWGASHETVAAARQHHMYLEGGYPKRTGKGGQGSIGGQRHFLHPERGYPTIEREEMVTQVARLIMVADAIEKMSSGRHGKKSMSLNQILEETRKTQGQFYREYLNAFIMATTKDRKFKRWWEEREKEMAKHKAGERQAPRRQREDGSRKYDQNR